MVAELKASSTEDLRSILNEYDEVTLSGSGVHKPFRIPPSPNAAAVTLEFAGIERHDASDQIIVIKANTKVADLQVELLRHGQCLPYLPFHASNKTDDLASVSGTVAGHLSMNLPHSYERQCGSWKDWLLGAKIMLASGLQAKCGSQVVKNVAGYDLHKFLIGSRGVIAVFTELTLRTWPVKALGEIDLQLASRPMGSSGLIQRTLPSDFASTIAEAGDSLVAAHPGTSTLYRDWPPGEPWPNAGQGWAVGWGLGSSNLGPAEPVTSHYLKRAKMEFDPQGKLNPTDLRCA